MNESIAPPSVGTVLKHGVIAGLAGGISLAVFLFVVAEPTIDAAVRFEADHHSGPAAPEMFSRSTQHLGGILGGAVYGIAVGALFALLFASQQHRLRGTGDWGRALRLGVAAFATVYLIPFFKYPANPPGVGDPATITRRTLLYVLMIAWSCAATTIAWRLYRGLAARGWSGPRRTLTVASGYGIVLFAALALLPPNRDPVRDPATLVWHFRMLSLASQAFLWAVTTAMFGILRHRNESATKPECADLPV